MDKWSNFTNEELGLIYKIFVSVIKCCNCDSDMTNIVELLASLKIEINKRNEEIHNAKN